MIDQDTRTDMYVGVNLHIDGSFDEETVTVTNALYSQESTDPPSNGVVKSDGTIDLRLLNKSAHHNNKTVHITFYVSGTIDGPNGPLPVTLPTNPDLCITINGNNPPFDEFSCQAGPEANSFVLTDNDVDKDQHDYCLQPYITYANQNFDVPVDPPIIDRGKTG